MWDAVRAGLGEVGNDLVFTKQLSLGVWGDYHLSFGPSLLL